MNYYVLSNNGKYLRDINEWRSCTDPKSVLTNCDVSISMQFQNLEDAKQFRENNPLLKEFKICSVQVEITVSEME